MSSVNKHRVFVKWPIHSQSAATALNRLRSTSAEFTAPLPKTPSCISVISWPAQHTLGSRPHCSKWRVDTVKTVMRISVVGPLRADISPKWNVLKIVLLAPLGWDFWNSRRLNYTGSNTCHRLGSTPTEAIATLPLKLHKLWPTYIGQR